jgi:SAM-dependent methyltransferase
MLLPVPRPYDGKPVRRHEPCRICESMEGISVATTDFWDLQTSDLVKCPSCGLIQLDPMLTAEATAKGCQAYYVRDITETSLHEQERNLLRNFRRGIVFGFSLKRKGYYPKEILELGPGSGYFAAGVQFVFPECRITVADILEEVLEFNRTVHGFKTIKGSPEDILQYQEKRFDLVIARDILEHVADIGRVVRNVASLLNPGGLFHFLTPNGHEDAWGHFVNRKLRNCPSELLINHVNYFDGRGLRDFLEKEHFTPLQYYTYQVKTTFRGKGRKIAEKLAAAPSAKRSAETTIRKLDTMQDSPAEKKRILSPWYLRMGGKRLAWLVCLYFHHSLVRIDPIRNQGHEIHGLFLLSK